MMKVLSIANQKGGVGKTVLSVNLAWELSRKGYCVLVVDLDPQCDLTKILYREKETPEYNIYDLLTGQCGVSDALSEVQDNLYIIPGSKDIMHFKLKKSENLLKKILTDETLKAVDVVIIDNPPSTNEITLLGYVAATDVVVVTDCEAFSVQNINSFMEDLLGVKDTMNPKLKIAGVIANRVDLRRNLTKRGLKEMKSHFGEVLFNTYVSNNTAIPISIRNNQTVRELKWHSPVLTQLTKVTKELEKRMGL